MYVSESYLNILTENPKIIKRVTTKNYKVEDYKNPPKSKIKKDSNGKDEYRTVTVLGKDGQKHLIKVALMNTPGPKGGMTKATSKWDEK
jgi:hypothetical protein